MKNESILHQTQSITKMEWIVNFSLLEDTRNFLVTYGFIYDNTLTSRSLVPTRTFLVNPGPGHPTNYWSNGGKYGGLLLPLRQPSPLLSAGGKARLTCLTTSASSVASIMLSTVGREWVVSHMPLTCLNKSLSLKHQ